MSYLIRRIFLSFLTLAAGLALLTSGTARAQEEKVVRAVEVAGNQAVSTGRILLLLQTRAGEPYRERTLAEDVGRLLATGFFAEVVPRTEPAADGGLRVIFQVRENPTLSQVAFSGNRKLRKEALLERSGLAAGQIYEAARVAEAAERLRDFYREKGLAFTTVEPKAEPAGENRMGVTFLIREAAAGRIAEIRFAGNQFYKREKLLRILQLKERSLVKFKLGTFNEKAFQDDQERIRALYRQAGFADVKVAGATRPAGRHLEVDFSIEEGRRYLAGPVNFSGDLLHTPEKLRALVRMKDGAPYSQAGLEADRSTLLNLYRDDGYLKARVEPVAVFNAASERVDLGYQVNPGPVVEVEGIEISGNTRTREGVIRREIKLAPGDRFDGRQLRRSIENLRDLNYFEDVNIQPEEGSAPEKAVLNFEVKERERTGNLMFGAGYSSVDGLIGLLAVEQNNFDWHNPPSFIGGGQTLRLSSDFGRQRQGYSLSFTNPYIYDRPVLFGFDLYDRARDYDEFDERRTGGGLRFGRRVNSYWSVSAMPRAERVDVSDISPFASVEYLKEEGENDIYSLTLAAARDTRDSRRRTTRGTLQEFSYKYAGGLLGGDRDFWRGDYDLTYYRKLGPAWLFSSQTRLGIADTMGGTSDVPIYERYFCGGARTVRGYEDRSLGPLDASGLAKGGNFTLVQNLELSRPIYQDILHLVFFADAGQAWWRANDLDLSELKSSVGAGFRLKVPIFPLPIKLDYGYALDPLPGEDPGRWHFLIDWWF